MVFYIEMKLNSLKLHRSNYDSGRKSYKKLWILLIIFIVILMIPLLLLGYMGLIPGLSNLMGTANPRDLGVRYSQNDVVTYKQKTSIQFKDYSDAPADPKNPAEKAVVSDVISVSEVNLTQEEITALLSTNTYSWMPVKDIQVRLTDNTIELSGSLNIDKIEEFNQYISGNNTASQDINSALAWAKRLRNKAPVYIKANASIIDNKLSFKLLDAEIGRLSIPLGSTGDDLSSGRATGNTASQFFSAKSAKLTDGSLKFQGTYPTIIYLKK